MLTIQGGNAIGVTLIHHVGVAGAACLRLAFGGALLFLILRPRVRVYSRAEVRIVLLFGLIVAAMSGSIYGALERLPLGVAVTISMLGPLTVASLGSHRRRDLIWPAIALTGVVLLANSTVSQGPSISPLGIVFALSNALAWGSYIVVSSHAGTRFGGVEGLASATVVAAVIWIPAGILFAHTRLLEGSSLLWGVLAGTFATALPYTLENLALRRLPARVFGTLMSLEPAIASLVGLVFLSQAPGALALVGMVFVTVASAGASLPDSNRRSISASPQ